MSGNDKKKSKKTMWIILIILVLIIIFYLYKQKNENMTYDNKKCDLFDNKWCFQENLTGIQKNNVKLFVLNGTSELDAEFHDSKCSTPWWNEGKSRANPYTTAYFFKSDFNNKINKNNLILANL
jgi:hypothetical protein